MEAIEQTQLQEQLTENLTQEEIPSLSKKKTYNEIPISSEEINEALINGEKTKEFFNKLDKATQYNKITIYTDNTTFSKTQKLIVQYMFYKKGEELTNVSTMADAFKKFPNFNYIKIQSPSNLNPNGAKFSLGNLFGLFNRTFNIYTNLSKASERFKNGILSYKPLLKEGKKIKDYIYNILYLYKYPIFSNDSQLFRTIIPPIPEIISYIKGYNKENKIFKSLIKEQLPLLPFNYMNFPKLNKTIYFNGQNTYKVLDNNTKTIFNYHSITKPLKIKTIQQDDKKIQNDIKKFNKQYGNVFIIKFYRGITETADEYNIIYPSPDTIQPLKTQILNKLEDKYNHNYDIIKHKLDQLEDFINNKAKNITKKSGNNLNKLRQEFTKITNDTSISNLLISYYLLKENAPRERPGFKFPALNKNK